MKNSLHLIIVLSCIATGLAKAEDLNHPVNKPSYSAELLSHNRHSANKKHKSRIIMSPHGVRIESKGIFFAGEKGIYIQNFLTKNLWVINPLKKHYALLSTDNNDAPTTANDKKDNINLNGVMSSRPCLGYTPENKRITGKEVFETDEIILYKCRFKDETVKQKYSLRWKMVISEEKSNGNITELKNIKASSFNKLFFQPPKKYLKIGLQEFYTGAPPLKRYEKTPHL